MPVKTETIYEIRKDGQTYCRSTVPDCGYSKETLRNMKAAGYRLYENGKLKR